jgi:DNA-binding SARP family transcriptional activator
VIWRSDGGRREVEITGQLQPRTRELLVYLALHPQGTGRDSLAAALWPDSPPDRIANTMNTALTRLRRALYRATDGEIADIVLNTDSRICLNPDLVDVDYWRFDTAVTARRCATADEQRLAAHQLGVDSYRGGLDLKSSRGCRIDSRRPLVRFDRRPRMAESGNERRRL